ncbi:MAG: phosphoribosylformimino-5-aminoimidazole carboxamide ribotide isomerase [Verrucomicrobia bacterium]|nr:MAG: phosphoribosylformimino-5-aminoimidazole carboxamide ribotide isomerase [Verrucomicrobiota bacterium]
MTKFRPCIDLHEGKVKQIVGGSLRDDGAGIKENFVSQERPAHYVARYQADGLTGGHVIKLGQGNDDAARECLAAWPGGLQLGGAITADNAEGWLDCGASHVIVTSWLFDVAGRFLPKRLETLRQRVGADRIVVDLSCRRVLDGWIVAMNRWQTLTDLPVSIATLNQLSASCSEFLIHAADVEGLCSGIDEPLVALLGTWAGKPVTYAGGVSTMEDVHRVDRSGAGRVNLTVGSALDLFGGRGVRYEELVAWNRRTPAQAATPEIQGLRAPRHQKDPARR